MSEDVASACEGLNVIVISDTYRLFPKADILYSGDAEWWRVHNGAPGFEGERWSSYNPKDEGKSKGVVAGRHGLKLIEASRKDGFSYRPDRIHYGSNSGFQALNLAILLGCKKIVLTGYDMRYDGGKAHWFGSHPEELRNPKKNGFEDWTIRFDKAVETLPQDIAVVNATPGTALESFPKMALGAALKWINE